MSLERLMSTTGKKCMVGQDECMKSQSIGSEMEQMSKNIF